MSEHGGGTNQQSTPDGDAAQAERSAGQLWKGRYTVEKELGRGGFGIVYLARDRELLAKPVVIKVLQEKAADPWFQKKFQQEIEALARIDHPGVVGVLDVGETPEGKPFLVMQFVEGVTLRSQIEPQGMNLRRAANIVRQVGQALSAAHEKGVLHRDLKPENVMLQRAGDNEEYVKLIDFGIAAVKDSQVSSQTHASKIVGTTAYMAPEQLLGQASPASDVYALGLIAYEMLTGRLPERLPQAVAVKPRQLRPDTPEAAEDVILKALSFRPEDRPARPRDLGDQLAVALGLEPAITRPLPALRPAAAEVVSSSGLEMAYVLFMDLVGYSTLPMDRQSQRIQQLQEIVRGTLEFRRAQQSDQLISLPSGDGMALVFFQNPVAPVQCATEIARALRNYPELKLRMGVHTGPVYRIADINTNRNVAGGGINLAQRVMDCGDAGHILVSRTVADILGQLSDWSDHLHDLGDHEVKHGVKVSLVNLYTGEVGNSQPPEKLQTRSVLSSRLQGQAQPLQAVPVPTARRGRMYAWAGGALALVITAGAAIQWMQRSTDNEPKEQQAPAGPSSPAPASAIPAAITPAAGTPPPSTAPPPSAAAPPPAIPGPSAGIQDQRPASGRGETVPPPPPASAPRPRRTAAPAAGTVVPPASSERPMIETSSSSAAPAPSQAQPSLSADRAALQELRERMILVAARAGAVSRSMQTMERQQSRMGVSMRPDMAAAHESMGYLLSEADSSLSAGDAATAKRNLDLAERQLEKLEGFLGR